MNTINVKPNKNSESQASLNQSSFPLRLFDGPVYFLCQKNDTSYFHTGSTLCLRTKK